jgi:nucleotide-binding universal stress UspA family protein
MRGVRLPLRIAPEGAAIARATTIVASSARRRGRIGTGFGPLFVFLPPSFGYRLGVSVKRLLVVATAPVDEEVLRARVREHAGPDAEVRVVAPASDLSPLEWLATDEDEARGEAADIARSAERAVRPEAGRVETEVGDSDPVQAIEDALRQFPADEIIVATRPGDAAGWLEKDSAEEASERFGVPVTHLVV